MNVNIADNRTPVSNTGVRIGSKSEIKPISMLPGKVPAENNEKMSADSELEKFIYSYKYGFEIMLPSF